MNVTRIYTCALLHPMHCPMVCASRQPRQDTHISLVTRPRSPTTDNRRCPYIAFPTIAFLPPIRYTSVLLNQPSRHSMHSCLPFKRDPRPWPSETQIFMSRHWCRVTRRSAISRHLVLLPPPPPLRRKTGCASPVVSNPLHFNQIAAFTAPHTAPRISHTLPPPKKLKPILQSVRSSFTPESITYLLFTHFPFAFTTPLAITPSHHIWSRHQSFPRL